MNEWILAGVVVVGTVFLLGGGGWIMSILSRKPAKKNDPKA